MQQRFVPGFKESSNAIQQGLCWVFAYAWPALQDLELAYTMPTGFPVAAHSTPLTGAKGTVNTCEPPGFKMRRTSWCAW